MSRAVECAAHGSACALAGGSKYRSEFCEPATPLLPQERELLQILAELQPEVTATRRPLTPARRDALLRETLAQAEADSAVREAQLLAGDLP